MAEEKVSEPEQHEDPPHDDQVDGVGVCATDDASGSTPQDAVGLCGAECATAVPEVVLTESKLCATRRLQISKQWGEATLYKDQRIRYYREKFPKNTPRWRITDLAWADMLAKYPPPTPVEKEPEPDPEPEPEPEPEPIVDEWKTDAFPICHNLEDTDFITDMKWVYRNITNAHLRPQDCPNSGTWAMYCWARENKNDFFKQLFPRFGAAVTVRTVEKHDAEKEQAAEVDDAVLSKLKAMMK